MTGKPRKPKAVLNDSPFKACIGDSILDLSTGVEGVVTQVLSSGAVMANMGDEHSGDSEVSYLLVGAFEVIKVPKEVRIKQLYACIDIALALKDMDMFNTYSEELKELSLTRYELAVIENNNTPEKPVITRYNRRRELEIVADLAIDMGDTSLFNEYSSKLQEKQEGEQ